MLDINKLHIKQGSFELRADLKLKAGMKIGVIGPSGAGKSTLLAALSGFMTPISGWVNWQGASITPLPPAERPISLLQQSHNLFTHLDIRQNAAIGLDAKLRLSKEKWARTDSLLEELGILELATKHPRQISGGQAARAALARVILQNRDIILLDEPFSALGPAQRQYIMQLINQKLLSDSRIILCVSHQIDEISKWADALIWIDQGKAIYISNAKKIYASKVAEIKNYLGQNQVNP